MYFNAVELQYRLIYMRIKVLMTKIIVYSTDWKLNILIKSTKSILEFRHRIVSKTELVCLKGVTTEYFSYAIVYCYLEFKLSYLKT